MKKKKVKEIGITALYERLSRDDDGDGDSNSIVHQKQMLEAYAKEHGFVNLRHYTDDGWSGASFDRPSWNELVAGVKAEEITTVIVKDLSRVGREDCYACSKHILTRQTYKAACSGHHIRTSALRSIVLDCIRKTCSYVQSNPEEFLELYNQISESQNQSHLQELRSRITKAEHRTKDIDALIRKIYEDNIAGRLSDKMLENLLEGYEKEKNELEEEQKDCQQQLDSAEKQADNTNHFIELAKKYTDFSELTPAMVNEFVSKIIVHRPFELNGTRAVQVEVYLNYIGKFDVPEEPMILSEEELATQKIREEKLEKHRIASRKYMAKYRKRLKEMKKAGTILPENLPAETKGEWL